MNKFIILCCANLLIQFSFAHAFYKQENIIKPNTHNDLNIAISLSIYDYYGSNSSGTTIDIRGNTLSCLFFSNEPEPVIDSTYTQHVKYVIGNPKYEDIQLSPEQRQKIQDFVKPIFLNSFMYINRLTDPNTFADNAYIVQLRINGQLYFETFGLTKVPYFTEFIQYIISIAPCSKSIW